MPRSSSSSWRVPRQSSSQVPSILTFRSLRRSLSNCSSGREAQANFCRGMLPRNMKGTGASMVSWEIVIDNRKPPPRFRPGPYFRAYVGFGSWLCDSSRTGSRPPPAPPAIPAIDAVENNRPNRGIVLRRNLQSLLDQLTALEPPPPNQGGSVEQLIASFEQTQATVAEFSRIAEMIAAVNDVQSALEVHRWFGRIFERYDLPEGFSGRFTDADFDYYKCLGHELFVTSIAFLLREER